MRFDPANPDRLTPVVWYFVPASRPWLDIPTPFRSRTLEIASGDELPLLGEVKERSWYRGNPPADFSGEHYCGTPQQWLNGAPGWEPVPMINGQPLCCGPDRAQVVPCMAHTVPSGDCVPEDFDPCPVWAPWSLQLRVIASGATGGYAGMNGTYDFTWSHLCTWVGTLPDVPACNVGSSQITLSTTGAGTKLRAIVGWHGISFHSATNPAWPSVLNCNNQVIILNPTCLKTGTLPTVTIQQI